MNMSNVISFLERKKIKERENRNKLMMPIYDFYIPKEEIPFWEQVAKFMPQYEQREWMKESQSEIDEFVTAFTVDIEMYREFGDKLKNFRFLFSYIEIYFLHQVLLEFECNQQDETLQYYRIFLVQLMKANEELSKLI